MSTSMTKIKTIHYKGLMDLELSTSLFVYLKNNIDWYDGIPSRIHGFTRKAYHYELGSDDFIDSYIIEACSRLKYNGEIYGIYMNYYRNGEDFTPNHKHDTKQIVLSLGSDRKLMIGSKPYIMGNGDAIEFGTGIHGVPKEPAVPNGEEGRISIAFFTPKP